MRNQINIINNNQSQQIFQKGGPGQMSGSIAGLTGLTNQVNEYSNNVIQNLQLQSLDNPLSAGVEPPTTYNSYQPHSSLSNKNKKFIMKSNKVGGSH